MSEERAQTLEEWKYEAETNGEAIMLVRHYLAEVGIEASFVDDVAFKAARTIRELRDDLAGNVRELDRRRGEADRLREFIEELDCECDGSPDGPGRCSRCTVLAINGGPQ